MAYVLKIKYADTLRRMIVKPNPSTGEVELPYAQLEQKIRNLFKIPSDVELVLTYKDGEDDVVTISEDEDLEDALVIQGLNPLRIDVKHGEDKQSGKKGERKERKPSGAKKDKEARSSSAPEYPSLAAMLEETLLPTMDSLKNMASGELNNLSEKLEQDAKLQAKLLSEVFKVFTKASTKDFTGKPRSGDQGFDFTSSTKEAAGSGEAAFPDAAAEFSKAQAAPNPCQSSFQGHGKHHTDGGVFHHGVQCDRCGVVPIVGPRYKSNKKEDYDLCLNCFSESQASEADYTRYDQPLKHYAGRSFGSHHSNKTPRCPYFQPHVFGRSGFGNRGGFHARHGHRVFNHNNAFGKLDCRFVSDVTIFDGTELPPGTPFTKIWRLRNSGDLPWPQNTELVHVGGDELGSDPVTSIELPVGGLPPDSEIEASVDLVAPENPGRYISHWRLMAPSGVKFGHRVWVSIQVVSKDDQSPQILESLKSDAENNHRRTMGEAPHKDGEDVVVEEIMEQVFVESMVNSSHSNSCFEVIVEGPSAPLADLVEEKVQKNVEDDAEKCLPVEGSSAPLVDLKLEVQKNVEDDVEKYLPESYVNENAKMENSELGAFSLVDIPNSITVKSSVTSKTSSKATSEISYSQAEIHPSVKEVESFSVLALAGLSQLAAMGFTDRSLNLELLEKNEYNLPHVLDELFSAVEWDPKLDELQEMGFTDVDLNRRLMFKNKGSLKRVVKELVQIYKESATRNK